MSEADLLEAYACLVESFRRHQPVDRPPTRQPAHLCDSACPLLNHRNLYMCCWSGHVHLCNEIACDRAVEHDGGRSCEVTGICYDLDFRVTFEQGDRSAQYRRNTRCASSASSSAAVALSDGLSIVSPTSAAAAAAAAAAAGPGARNRSLQNQLRVAPETERMEMRSLVQKLLPALSEARRATLTSEIFESYQRVKTTQPFLAHSSGRYTLALHTSLALFAMAQTGITPLGHVFLAAHADVRAHLPSLDACTAMLGEREFRNQYKSSMKALYTYALHWCRS